MIVPFHQIDAQDKAFIFKKINIFAISLYFSSIFDRVKNDTLYPPPDEITGLKIVNKGSQFLVFFIY